MKVTSRLYKPFAPGVVLDPFMGSGSTLLAARAFEGKAIGIEVSERYCEIAAQRMSQSAMDLVGATNRGKGSNTKYQAVDG